MTTDAQSFLDQKFEESYRLIEQEKRRRRVVGKLETLMFLLAIGLLIAFMQYTFWGEGYSTFLPETHDASVASLAKMPGPQAQLLENAMATQGFVSWMEYSAYIDMANEYKAANLPSLERRQLATK